MMLVVADPSTIPLSPEEYLRIERDSDIRTEYLDGTMYMMAGANRLHGNIVTNLVRELSTHLLDKPCEVHSHDMRVHIPHARAYFYPDVVIGCDEFELTDEIEDHLSNPLVIIEIDPLSDDRFEPEKKLETYKQISTLQHYIAIHSDKPLIGHLTKESNHWFPVLFHGLDKFLNIPFLNLSLSFRQIYLGVLE
jgi:Uma2 family endonuclease